MSDLKVQSAGNLAGFSCKKLLRSQKIGIRHEEVPVMVPPMEPSIGVNNQMDFTISTGVVQAPHALKTPGMQ